MGMLDKRIQSAVNEALKPLEKTLTEMAKKNAEHNRNLIMMKVDAMHKDLERLVEAKVKEALKKDV